MLSKHKDLNKNCFSKNANASKNLAQNLTKLQVYCVCVALVGLQVVGILNITFKKSQTSK